MSYNRDCCPGLFDQLHIAVGWVRCEDSVHTQIESKIFFCYAKTNTRGLYLKISEKKANRERSTIIIPGRSLPWFRELFNYYATTDPSYVLRCSPSSCTLVSLQVACASRPWAITRSVARSFVAGCLSS